MTVKMLHVTIDFKRALPVKLLNWVKLSLQSGYPPGEHVQNTMTNQKLGTDLALEL